MAKVSKAVLITGCSTGIGRATAERMAANGWTVYATARRIESIADLESKGCKLLALDVCDSASIRAAVTTIEAAEGAVGVLVNNAGYGQEGAIEEVPMAEVRSQFETNVFGLLELTKLVLPGMRAQGWGRVINVGSMGGRLTFPGGGIYHASKYAVEAISDALRFEVRGFGIKVSLIEPGFIRTEWSDAAIKSMGTGAGPGPYAAFNRSVAANVANAYSGALSRLSRGPEAVAAAIEHAAGSRRPRTRYAVAPSATLLIKTRRWLPDPIWDAILRRQYTTPRR